MLISHESHINLHVCWWIQAESLFFSMNPRWKPPRVWWNPGHDAMWTCYDFRDMCTGDMVTVRRGAAHLRCTFRPLQVGRWGMAGYHGKTLAIEMVLLWKFTMEVHSDSTLMTVTVCDIEHGPVEIVDMFLFKMVMSSQLLVKLPEGISKKIGRNYSWYKLEYWWILFMKQLERDMFLYFFSQSIFGHATGCAWFTHQQWAVNHRSSPMFRWKWHSNWMGLLTPLYGDLASF